MSNKVILFDVGFFAHRSILAFSKTTSMTIGYLYLRMILACLKRIGVGYEDLVILCKDSHNSWRKDCYPLYKANRRELREKQEDADFWHEGFREVDQINEKITNSTNWHLLSAERLEADDLISESCRVFRDKEIIIVSIDSDLKQLCAFNNVKFFTKVKKEWTFVDVENPVQILQKKIMSGDKSDNIIGKPNSEQELQIRNKIINLLELPDEISKKARKVLIDLPIKNFDWLKIPFQHSIKNQIYNLYEGIK